MDTAARELANYNLDPMAVQEVRWDTGGSHIIICSVQCDTDRIPVLGKPNTILPVSESENVENHKFNATNRGFLGCNAM
jgi:hypothetical protein